jgi:hypothetical protein
MGWWSKDIMGGDSPLDVKDEIYGICEVDEFPEDGSHKKISKADLEKHLPKILEFLRKQENNDYYDEKSIGFQVLGVMMMEAGAKISEDLKKEILEESAEDSWAKEDKERDVIVKNFEEALRTYIGKPVVIRSKGLFEVISEKISSGTPGLVNTGKNL